MPEESAEKISRHAVECVLSAVAREDALHQNYVLKGGLALEWVYGSPRRSSDLDFNAVTPSANTITEETSGRLLAFRRTLDAALRDAVPYRSIEQVQTADTKLSTEIPVLLGQIVYMTVGGSSGAIPMQVTLSEIICAADVCTMGGIPIHVASLEDIVAEKLKAILQQPQRDTVRSSDVYDVSFFTTRAKNPVQAEDVTPLLLEKLKQWPSMPLVSKKAYRGDAVLNYSRAEYDSIRDHLEPDAEFVPFAEAYKAILEFVDRLALPD